MALKEANKKRKALESEATTSKKQKQVEKTVAATTDDRTGGTVVAKKAKTSKPPKTIGSDKNKKTTKIQKAVKAKPARRLADTVDEEESDLDLAAADQTAELLKGFESSDDEEEQGGAPIDAAPIPESDIPDVPANASSALSKRTANNDNKDAPATLYVGRVPHGFYEPQMRAYFSQFGEINHLRLSRNKHTGASKHYAFVEFSSAEVARIVADTMNNYLLFNHILKVRLLSDEQIARMGPALWAGEGKRFKVMPWGGIERGHLKSADRTTWNKRVGKEQRRRSARAAKLKELGYDFEPPAVEPVNSVPTREAPAVEDVAASGKGDTKSTEAKAVKQMEAAPEGKSDIQELIAAQKPTGEDEQTIAVAKKTRKTKDGAQVDQEAVVARAAGGSTVKKTKKKVKIAA